MRRHRAKRDVRKGVALHPQPDGLEPARSGHQVAGFNLLVSSRRNCPGGLAIEFPRGFPGPGRARLRIWSADRVVVGLDERPISLAGEHSPDGLPRRSRLLPRRCAGRARDGELAFARHELHASPSSSRPARARRACGGGIGLPILPCREVRSQPAAAWTGDTGWCAIARVSCRSATNGIQA